MNDVQELSRVSGMELTTAHSNVRGAELIPHWSNEHGCLCSHDHWILRYVYENQRWSKVCRLPPSEKTLTARLRDGLARSWVRTRFFPGPGLENVACLDSQTTLIIHDRVYLHRVGREGMQAKALPWKGSRPLYTPLTDGIAVHPVSKKAYFGEYLNGRKLGVRIYCVDAQTESVQVCWTFSGNDAKHVHAVHYDRFRNRLWVCTGDLDHESVIYFTDDEFVSLKRFGGGDQSWRAIALLFDESGVEWGMDAGKDAPAETINRIYRHDFATGQRTERAVIGNPAYAACDLNDGTAVMATNFEPGRRQDTPEEVALWHRGPDGMWRKVMSMPHMHRPRKGQGAYGQLLLPRGVSPQGHVLVTPINTRDHHYHLLDISLPSPQPNWRC